jgi:alkanesulfonate monooxygenase SsuD/methylene tetrahydromethanopterin reductase-like flavin-dependent oxidoreductase (luciferase family)
MTTRLPAISLAAVPGRRKATLELAQEIERRGFPGIYCPSFGDGIGLCEAIALSTREIRFGTSITPIYTRNVQDFAQTIAFIHEISDGRFVFGVGVSHAPAMKRMGISQGKPLADMRNFIKELRAVPRTGDLPPIALATLRKKMIGLSEEIAEGMVFANGARSHMADSLSVLGTQSRSNDRFFIGNMIPTCISDDEAAAKAVNRRTLTGYAMLPNYRNYWKEAGYVEEMEAIETAVAEKRMADVPEYLTDAWLADCTLFGSAARVRDGLEAWYAAGVTTPILVPSSASGNQMKAIDELFATFTG